MAIKTIQLYPDDDINSMRDRLDWAGEEQVIFVMPDEGDLLNNEVDLAVLARHADGLRIQLGLVTQEPAVRQKASSMGFPTFLTEDLAETSRREWRRQRIRPDGIGIRAADLPAVFDEVADRRQLREQTLNQPPWRYWSRQVLMLILVAAGLIAAIIGLLTIAPSATVTITPAREKISVQKEIVSAVNPSAPENESGNLVDARTILLVASWQSDLVPTGQAELAANPARGKIVFANLTDQSVQIPAGIVLSTAADQPPVIQFRTNGAAELPSTVGATVEIDIVALNVGLEGNLPPGQIRSAEGDWGNRIEVRQPLPTSGGNVQPVPVVTEADQAALRTEVVQQLQSLAAGQIESALGSNEFLSVESLAINQILNENWSHPVGSKSDRLTLGIEAEISGTVVDFNQATDLVYTDLVAGVRPGFSLTPDSFRFYKAGGTRLNEQGQVVFDMVGEGTMTALVESDNLLEEIVAKDEAEAAEILQAALNLDSEPVFRVIPNWFGRLPNYPSRIEIILDE